MNIRFYRANKSGTGTCVQFSLSGNVVQGKYPRTEYSCFMSIAKQIGKDDNDFAKFDWDNVTNVKLGQADIAEILAVFQGFKEAAGGEKGLYHTSKAGTKQIQFKVSDKQPGYFIGIRTTKEGEEPTSVYGGISDGESLIVRKFLEKSLEYMFGEVNVKGESL